MLNKSFEMSLTLIVFSNLVLKGLKLFFQLKDVQLLLLDVGVGCGQQFTVFFSANLEFLQLFVFRLQLVLQI